MASLRLNLVVAASSQRGIGINGQLPWRIKGDMAFFKRITSEVSDNKKQNAVIMGRKTWESIPEKFRPLQNRYNIVLSRSISKVDGAHVADSLDAALEHLRQPSLAATIEQIYIIGGSSVYAECLESPLCYRIYLTQVYSDVTCDTFLPEFNTDLFKLTPDPNVNGEIQEENGIKYKIEVYEKGSMRDFYCMAAMDNNRGIGYADGLPWPQLRQDYEYYTQSQEHTNDPDKVNMVIYGRTTWLSVAERELKARNINVVVSRSIKELPPYANYLVPDLDSALTLAARLPVIETVWVNGGQMLYETAMKHPNCRRVYRTRVYGAFKADTFLPQFEHNFTQIQLPEVDGTMKEDNGVKYQFEVFERK
ncbi:uncharacterized protein LOC141913886 [Tubulanus polymorphus]|uniref:uncharacterized protein LOC141913886 n=1 Tax=Tubulanus polymorphus TaxID=672921 RepID=UPI003DA46B4B